MIVWRICKSKYVSSAFTGVGAEKIGGRLNFRGSRVVYASENLSLATLELFVHVNPRVIPSGLVVVLAQLPKRWTRQEIKISDLPSNWRQYPVPTRLQELGTEWLNSNSSLALVVPSAVNPFDKNILLNPSHPQMKDVKVEPPEPFDFDPRMFA